MSFIMIKKLYIHTAPIYKALIKMMLFLAAASAVAFETKEHIAAIWYGSPEINSFILAIFAIGVWLSIGSARKVARTAEAINAGGIEPDSSKRGKST
jgi:hypothetical protein